MIWPFSILQTSNVAFDRRVFFKLFTAGAFGAVIGISIAVFAVIAQHGGIKAFLEAVPITTYIGIVFGVTFYITCGLPAMLLAPFLNRLKKRYAKAIRMSIAAAGGAIAYSIAVVTIRATTGIELVGAGHMGYMLAVEALAALIISMIIGGFREKEIRVRELSEMAAKAQAAALQAQINPHFFFNTLNTVAALIPEHPEAAQATLCRMADLFRYTLTASQAEMVTIEQELAFVQNYLTIEKARFQDRLTFHIAHPNGLGNVRLPGLTLQPLVENAVRYGIARSVSGGVIHVNVDKEGDDCRISVRNDVDPCAEAINLDDVSVFRPGHALANIRERLKLAYGGKASIHLQRETEDVVTSTVVIPLSK